MPEPANPTPAQKETRLQVRLDDDLARRANAKAEPLGGLSVVVRALLRTWLESGVEVTPDSALRERVPAARRRAKPRKRRK